MKTLRKYLALVLSLILCISAMAGCSAQSGTNLLDPAKPTTVTIWNYYNGDQLSAFETLVNQFNNTIGAEKGIVVVSVSQGSIDNLATSVLDSVEGKVGAADVPSAAALYSETVYILNSKEMAVPLDSYFTDEELAEYVPSFIDEGRLSEGGDLYLLPVSKSTEAFVANTTDWASFTEATGVEEASIETYEDLAAAAEEYYNWTDSLTPELAEDGKALYGRDSFANYIYVGAKQLGHELFKVGSDGKVSVDFDRDTFKTMWDNYYIPYINGYFASYSSHRSEDIKTGAVIAMTGSTSGITYVPTEVTDSDDVSHEIEVDIRNSLVFKDATEPVQVQQGAGYCVLKTSEAEQYATVEFLKWFTDVEQNLDFSVTSGYSPVKTEANDAEKITADFTVDSAKTQNMLDALLVSADAYTSGNTYTCKAFGGSKDIRDILENAMEGTAVADRETVLSKITSGVSREEATAEFTTDEYFESWFTALKSQVEALVS